MGICSVSLLQYLRYRHGQNGDCIHNSLRSAKNHRKNHRIGISLIIILKTVLFFVANKSTMAPKRQSLDATAILDLGLRFMGANDRERNTKLTTRITRFRTLYGSHPLVYSKIWDDLWLYQVDDERKIGYFFLCLHFLKEYDKESVLGLKFHRNEETAERQSNTSQ